MYGNLHLPGDPTTSQCDVFGGMFAAGGTNAWQVWRKPSGKYSSLFIVAIGSGGGGGGGIAGDPSQGGGGGGSSSIARALYPMWAIPETLHVSVPFGGVGGAPSVAGGDGDHSLVCVYPHPTAVQDRLIISGGANVAGGGLANGGAGAAGSTPSLSSYPLAMFSMMLNTAGQAGSVLGSAVTVGTTTMFTGGASGCNGGGAPGAAINAPANTPYVTSAGGIASATVGQGNSGFRQYSLFMGGSGGGSAAAGNAGPGGSCGSRVPGCGGGGSGAGANGGFRGGDGGDGLVLLVAF